MTYDVIPPHLHTTSPLYGGYHVVLLQCCFAMIQSPEGSSIGHLCSHVTFDVIDLLYLYNWQLGLGLGLVTLILSSVVNHNRNPDPNPKRICRKNVCDDSSGSV